MSDIVLIVPSATYRAQDFVEAAAALGARVVVASDRRPALAAAMGERSIVVDLDGPEAAAEAIATSPAAPSVRAVVGVDDQGALVAALASRRLGLRHNPPEAVAAARDKALMRAGLARAGVAQPRWRLVGPQDDVAAAASEVGLPCVVKPTRLAASRGVIRADDLEGAAAAAERSRSIAAGAGIGADLLVEQYVSGAEVAVEGLLRAGRLEVLAVFDKPDPLEGPYFEETIYVTPSRLDPGTTERIAERTGAAARALGLLEGPLHAELRLGGDLPVIEIAARSIGGLCSRALRFGMNTSLEEIILRHALGLGDAVPRRRPGASGVMMIPIPHSGTLRSVGRQAEARAVEGVEGLQITIGPNRPVRALPEGDRYLGFLFATAATPEEVEAALRKAHGILTIDIEEP